MKNITTMILPDELERMDKRCKELINAIQTINQYEPYLRMKYYTVLEHSIKLLLQYTLIIKDNTL